MKRIVLTAAALTLVMGVQASWYWPFGSDSAPESSSEPRLSELVEPASKLIDDASDLAADGKTEEAIAKYREALLALDRIENEYPERAKAPESASVRNKRAYVNAAIDAMLLAQVRENAKVVAVSDTTELEKRFAEEQEKKRAEKEGRKAEAKTKPAEKKVEEAKKSAPAKPKEKKTEAEKPVEKAVQPAPKQSVPVKALTPREQAAEAVANGKYEVAAGILAKMLEEKPNDPAALNLRAMMEASRGDLKAAEATLDLAIMNNPRNYYAYYNMAELMLQKTPPSKYAAKRYYETGRAMGGPADRELEEACK